MERIFFSRGQEDDWDADELYAQIGALPPERVAETLEALRRERWQFLNAETRERFLLEWLPEFEELFDLLPDFRFGGYRVLGNILLDIDQENTAQNRKRLNREGDSAAFAAMMNAYQKKAASQSLPDPDPLFCAFFGEIGPGRSKNMREERLLTCLKETCPGRKYQVGGSELQRALGLSGTDLRKLVNQLWPRGVPIASDCSGYFYAVTAG